MAENIVENQVDNTSIKELNFRALEKKYQVQLEQERAGRLEAERIANETRAKYMSHEEDDTESEPYVDHKRLKKSQERFGQQLKQETQTEINKAVQQALYEERNRNWLSRNSDFEETMKHAQKLYELDQELADTILEMPNNFERQKLVYKNIKALGLDKPQVKQPSIQDKVDANRKSPYYQPTGVGTAPYSSQSDFSDSGQKNAYDKMKDLQKRLRI